MYPAAAVVDFSADFSFCIDSSVEAEGETPCCVIRDAEEEEVSGGGAEEEATAVLTSPPPPVLVP